LYYKNKTKFLLKILNRVEDKMKKAALLVTLLGMLIIFTSCQPAPVATPASAFESSKGNENYTNAPQQTAMEMPAEAPIFDTALGNGEIASEPLRLVIRNADLMIIVSDPASATQAIGRMAERLGGYVVNSNIWQSNFNGQEHPEGSVTVRVPAEKLNQALDEIKGLTNGSEGDVLNENISGQDVTKEYTDLNSRLTNLEDAEFQLRTIMNEAKKTEDVLNVFNQLNAYREQIEITKGQIQYYEEAAALSAISVQVRWKEVAEPVIIQKWSPGITASKALRNLVDTLQSLADALIWLALLVLPVLLVLGIPVLLVVWLARKVNKRSQKKTGVQT
jgi:flagellar basal body-associated protein FliL